MFQVCAMYRSSSGNETRYVRKLIRNHNTEQQQHSDQFQ